MTAIQRSLEPTSAGTPLVQYHLHPHPSGGGPDETAGAPPPPRGILTNARIVYDPVIAPPVTAVAATSQGGKRFGCGGSASASFWQGRSCAERFIFGLLVALIVSVFVIGGLICLQV